MADFWDYALHEGGNLASPGNYYYVESFLVNRVLPEQYEMSRVLTAERSGESTTSAYRITRDLNGYARQNASFPWQEARWVQWPLEPGRTWKFEVPIAAGIRTWEAHVTGWEEVEVPAGKFKAIRVVLDLIANPDPLLGWKTTVWYSPEVKWFVKKTDYGTYEASVPIRRDTRELKKYRLH